MARRAAASSLYCFSNASFYTILVAATENDRILDQPQESEKPQLQFVVEYMFTKVRCSHWGKSAQVSAN